MRLGSILALLLTTLIVAAPAVARPVVELDHVYRNHFTGPRLAGDSAVWATLDSPRWTVHRGNRHETRTVGTISGDRPVTPVTTPQLLAMQEELEVEGAPWGMPLRTVDPICGNGGEPSALAASGLRIAHVVCIWEPGQDTRYVLRVRDLGDGSVLFELPFDDHEVNWNVGDIVLAGNLLGLRVRHYDAADPEPTDLVVYDVTTGARRVAYSTTDSIKAWDLRADGSIAVALERRPWTGSHGELGWVDPAGTWHRMLDAEIVGDRLRFAGDAVATELPRAAAPGALTTLALVRLDGRVRPLARFDTTARTSAGTRLEGFDFDGERVTWADGQCLDVRVHLSRVADARTAGLRARRPCWSADLMRTRASVDRRGHFTLQLGCRKRCAGELTVTLRGRQVAETFDLRGSRRWRPVRLDLGPAAARLLRRRGPMVAEAVVTSTHKQYWQRALNRTDLTLTARG